MQLRRAMMYMPGDDLHKIQKGVSLQVDSLCMDIEDGVAPNRKQAARETIRQALGALDFGRSERLVRINAVGSGLEADDLQAVLPAHPDGIVVPKVSRLEQLRWVDEKICAVEQAQGWAEGSVALVALVETAQAVVNLREIAGAGGRLQALVFGADDLAGDIGAVRTRPGWEVFYARSAVVTYAAAFGLQAIDMVYFDLKDLAGLQSEALQGAEMGYTGKQVIHPNQVVPVQEAFTPVPEAVAYAQRVVEEAARQAQAGSGAFALDGKMIDGPVIRSAERLLERARAARKI